jgi:hypothetical protein
MLQDRQNDTQQHPEMIRLPSQDVTLSTKQELLCILLI